MQMRNLFILCTNPSWVYTLFSMSICAVPFDGELNEFVEKVGIREARGFPQFRKHADRGETGDRVDFVKKDFRAVTLHKKIDTRHAGTIQDLECLACDVLDFSHRPFRKVCRNDRRRFAVDVLGIVVVEFVRRE